MNLHLRSGVFTYLFLFLFFTSTAQTTTTYTSTSSWTVPSGVTSIVIKVYGGGGGVGGQDCGNGCYNPAAGPVGYIYASYTVTPGDIIDIYPGGKGTNGANSVNNSGGGTGGVSPYNTNYNGGNGGNVGPNGSSGGGGGGGAATIVTLNSVVKFIAGGAGGGGGMANYWGSGQPGNAGTSANGTLNNGGNGASAPADGGGGGGGGGGQYGSVGGGTFPYGAERAGYGGYRGGNAVTGANGIFENAYISWTNGGKVEISYGYPVSGGTVSSDQTICSGTQPSPLNVTGFYGTSLQWQYSDDNNSWNDISGATTTQLSMAQMGSLTQDRWYRLQVDGGAAVSNSIKVTVFAGPVSVMPAGDGTEEDPYLISSFEELLWIGEDPSRFDKYYKQTADIDAVVTSTSCYNSGQGWLPIGSEYDAFTGNYDGNGHTISNLYINRTSELYSGLFGNCSNATIKNLMLKDVNISGARYVAPFAPYANGTCTFSKLGSSGSINGSGYTGYDEIYMGGIAGYLQCNGGTVVDQSFSTANITNYGDAFYHYNGGLVAAADQTAFTNSYYIGTIWDDMNGMIQYTGGIAGVSNGGSFEKLYVSADLNAYAMYYGEINIILGYTASGDPVSNCYFNYYRNYYWNNYGGDGLADNDMQQFATFFNYGWDMQCETTNGTENIWGINNSDNGQFPFLKWQGYTTGCPQWNGSQNNTFAEGNNWDNGLVPAEGMDIYMSPTAAQDLVLPSNWNAGNIVFNGAGVKIKLNGNHLTLGGTITGADATNYIQTNGAGTLRKRINDGSAFSFATGNSAFNPVTITNNSGADDDFDVRVVDAVYNDANSGVLVGNNHIRRTWHIGKTNPNGGSGIDFEFHWNSGEENHVLGSKSLFHYDGAWVKQNGTTSSTATSLTYTGYTGTFSPFSILDPSTTLPVSWLSFTAQKQGKVTNLNWSTASEQGADRFVVQHSTDAVRWNNIGTVAAAGNSNTTQQYNHVHGSPVNGVNYYRILQVDADGRQSYSKVVSVNFGNVATFRLYPNPVTNGQLQVQLSEDATIRVYNLLGVMVQQKTLKQGTHVLDLSKLPKAVYRVQVNDESVSIIIQ